MLLASQRKSWIYPAFFLFYLSVFPRVTFAQEELIRDTSTSPHWHALIHSHNGKPKISDSNFLLSSDNFSAEKELRKTLALFKDKSPKAYCRFPARYFYLKDIFELGADIANTQSCPELQKYLDYVPFDTLELVFASEVLTSSSSMMGHTFLKASGKNTNNKNVAHSISFFAEISTFNPFSVFYDSLVAGLDGFFMVRPYTKDHARYLEKENRNLWSYNLSLNNKQKKLLQAHIWELKDIELKYLFQSYNCSTLTLHILSILEPNLKQEERLFVSPSDVVKAVKKHELVSSENVYLSNDWELSMLEANMPSRTKRRVLNALNKETNIDLADLGEKDKKLALMYTKNIINRKITTSPEQTQRIKNTLELLEKQDEKIPNIVLNEYKSPINKPQDSALSAAILHKNKAPHLEISLLPASHYLHGDNRQLFTESELKIAEIILDIDLENSALKLKEFTLYSATSYNPSNVVLPQISGAFHLGYKQTLNNNFSEEGNLNLSGAVGKTFHLHRDVLFFTMIESGLLSSFDDASLYATPQSGLIFNLMGNSKLILEKEINFGQLDNALHSNSAIFSWYGLNNFTIKVQYNKNYSTTMKSKYYSLGVDFHF